MFKPGSIRKIEVTNFVTYTYTEFYPGPNLNMLIGPNGTGKSTMVAAIILGLGGNPKVVGRGTRVSEYVKHNCNDATINIYLQGADEKEFVKITRMFSNQDRTVWAINNKKVPVKNVLDHIKQYNIQVDNLCQFLPQDRVQDFAKLNQKDLLKATQIAVGREDLVEIQQRLIESRENFKNISASIKKSSEKLVEAQNANGRLSSKVENFKTKKKCLTQVQDIVRKTAWVQFDEFYASMSVFKEDLKNATNVHEKYKNEAKPMEKQIQESKKMVTDLQHVGTNITRGIKERESSISNNLEKLDQYQHSISRVRNDMNSKIQAIEQKEKEIETNSTLIELMKVTQKELLDKCGNDEQVQQKLRKVTTEMQKFKNHVKGLQDRRDELSVAKQNHTGQLRAYENEMVRLENVKQQRLEYLRRKDGDAFAAVEWLRANKHMFKGEVFEPMLLEINVLDSKNGLFLENVISFQDQLAFTCVEKEDMNALIKYLRGDKRLTVNVVHSGNTGEPITSFQPAIPIEQLKRYGLYTYLHSLFTAPEPIMRYLCKTYNLHNIPIGDNTTNRYFEDLPHQIRVFFSDKQRYSVSYSKYTGAKSIKQNDIDSSGALSISVDVLRFERLRGQIEEIRHSITTCDEQMSEFSSQINQINEKVSRMGEDLRSIHSVKQQIQSIASRITAMQKKIVELRQSGSSRDAIRNDARKKIQVSLPVIEYIFFNDSSE